MKYLILIALLINPWDAHAAAQLKSCGSLFIRDLEIPTANNPNVLRSPDNRKEAVLSEDGHVLTITNLKTKTKYSFESNNKLFGRFSRDSEFWVMKNSASITLWDFSGPNSRVINIELKNAVMKSPTEFKNLEMSTFENPVTKQKFLRIRYLQIRHKLEGNGFIDVMETIERRIR